MAADCCTFRHKGDLVCPISRMFQSVSAQAWEVSVHYVLFQICFETGLFLCWKNGRFVLVSFLWPQQGIVYFPWFSIATS